jgi:hypothetical protein
VADRDGTDARDLADLARRGRAVEQWRDVDAHPPHRLTGVACLTLGERDEAVEEVGVLGLARPLPTWTCAEHDRGVRQRTPEIERRANGNGREW